MLVTRYVTRIGLAFAIAVAIVGLTGAVLAKSGATPAPRLAAAQEPANYVG